MGDVNKKSPKGTPFGDFLFSYLVLLIILVVVVVFSLALFFTVHFRDLLVILRNAAVLGYPYLL